MKRMLKSFTFWFAVIGFVGIVLNLVGIDDINLFIGFNPILNILSSSEVCNVINTVPYLWYILSIVTMICYGLVIDGIRVWVKKGKDGGKQ